MEQRLSYIIEKIGALGLEISPKQAEQFYQYYETLYEWNQFMNLTGITEFESVVQKHFVDSLSIIYIKDMENVDSLIDIGTGAGFPGIPLKIAFPNLRITLLDSLNKRIRFLNEVINKTGLCGIETIHGRAEDYARSAEHRESYDICVSRAVANLSTLSEYSLPYAKINGEFISYKSGEIAQELEEAKTALFLLGGKVEECKTFTLPGSDIYRSLIKIKKVNSCPQKYPRKSGLPSKEPLH